MKSIIYVAFAIFLLSCNSSKSKSAQSKEMTSGTYTVLKVGSEDMSTMGITFAYDAAISGITGSAGCNNYSATANVSDNGMIPNNLSVTKKYCDGKMKAETAYINSLKAVQSYEFEGTTIRLLDGSGTMLIEMK